MKSIEIVVCPVSHRSRLWLKVWLDHMEANAEVLFFLHVCKKSSLPVQYD